MPSPAVYVVAVVAGVAAGLAFKEFIYDPHLAPKIEEWATSFAAYRRERRRRRASPYARSDDDDDDDDGRKGGGGSPPPRGDGEHKPAVELTSIVEREMQDISREGSLRHRQPLTGRRGGGGDDVPMLEKPNAFIPFEPLSPTARLPSASFSPAPSPSASYGDVALPIGHLPSPGPGFAGAAAAAAAAGQRGRGTPAGSLAVSSQATTQSPEFFTPRGPSSASVASAASGSASARGSPAPSHTASEYEYVLSTNTSEAGAAAGGSRATTPFTDARSATPFDELLGSEAGSSSDAELLAAAAAGYSDAEEEAVGQSGGDVDVDVDVGADFLRLPRVEAGGGESEMGSEDWERVSSV